MKGVVRATWKGMKAEIDQDNKKAQVLKNRCVGGDGS